MLTLYDYWESGNCYKVRLLLAQLGRDYRRVAVDILAGGTTTDEFGRLNPNRRVPVLAWPDGRSLAESNAILWHLAEDTPFAPGDAWARAQALQWMFFEQYSHEPYIAVVRFWHFAGQLESNRAQLADKMERGHQALAVMDQHLAAHDWFNGAAYGIADIALYAYTHVAHEGGFDLSAYPATIDWLARVAGQPGYITLDQDAPAH